MAKSKETTLETFKAITVDAVTGEVTERDLTAEEIADHLAIKAEADARQAEADAKAAARENALAKLAKLGLTAEEIAAL
jgi:hypothetical protein